MTRALVLGASGHIGAHVTRALLGLGYAVRASYRNPRYAFVLDGLTVERAQVDLDQPQQLRRAAEGCEWVFCCAGFYPSFTAPRRPSIQRGIEQVRRVFDALGSRRPERIVYTSSAATIAPQRDRSATETDAESWPLTRWRPLYAAVKIAMEHEVRRYVQDGLPVVITKPSVCLGEYDARPFSGRLILLFASGRLPVYLDHELNAVYTGDVGLGHALAAERGRIGESYLLAAHQVRLGELAKLVAREAGVRPPRWRLPYPVVAAAALSTEAVAAVTRAEPLLPLRAVQSARHHQRVDGSKAQRELGLTYTPLEQAVRRAVIWFRQHGYLKWRSGKVAK